MNDRNINKVGLMEKKRGMTSQPDYPVTKPYMDFGIDLLTSSDASTASNILINMDIGVDEKQPNLAHVNEEELEEGEIKESLHLTRDDYNVQHSKLDNGAILQQSEEEEPHFMQRIEKKKNEQNQPRKVSASETMLQEKECMNMNSQFQSSDDDLEEGEIDELAELLADIKKKKGSKEKADTGIGNSEFGLLFRELLVVILTTND